MKYFNLLALSIVLLAGLSNALTCDEAKKLLNIEYEGNCCDLQQINCDETNENILSIESLLTDYDFDEEKPKLYPRKGGGGHGGGGHSSGGHSSSSHSSSSGSHYYGGGYRGGSSSGAEKVSISLFMWIGTFALLLFHV